MSILGSSPEVGRAAFAREGDEPALAIAMLLACVTARVAEDGPDVPETVRRAVTAHRVGGSATVGAA